MPGFRSTLKTVLLLAAFASLAGSAHADDFPTTISGGSTHTKPATKAPAPPAPAPAKASASAHASAPESARAPAPARATAPPPITDSCIRTESEAQRSPEFKKALKGVNVFTRWFGPYGAWLDVSPDGRTVLYHPLKGPISLAVSLCLNVDTGLYLAVNGRDIPFDPKSGTVMVPDRESGKSYEFRRTAQ